jgi:hypothetical protein
MRFAILVPQNYPDSLELMFSAQDPPGVYGEFSRRYRKGTRGYNLLDTNIRRNNFRIDLEPAQLDSLDTDGEE